LDGVVERLPAEVRSGGVHGDERHGVHVRLEDVEGR
jgi:hypothetical protein